jgi:hypothetical protein
MRTSCVAIITLVLLIGSAGVVAATMNKEEIPATFVTGTVIDDAATEDEGRVVYEQTVDWSDSRLPSTLQVEGAWYLYGDVTAALERIDAGESEDDAFASGVVMVVEMNVLLDGDEGSWRGTGRGIEQGAETDPDRRYSYYVLSGDGAYEGFHALLRGTPGHDADGPWDEEYEGWIIESPLPLLPDSPRSLQPSATLAR